MSTSLAGGFTGTMLGPYVHALEVAQVATAVARACRLNVPLVEAIALGHDCGHGPGGHASEDAFAAFDTYFSAFDSEEGPPKGFAKEAPGTIVGSTFEIQPGQSIWMTIEVPKGGVYFINTTNTESEDEESTVDKFVKVEVK